MATLASPNKDVAFVVSPRCELKRWT